MKNNIKKIVFFISLFLSVSLSSFSSEQFNFDITEIEITENGNKFKGLKRGTVTSNNGTIIDADEFIYEKILNILSAKGNVKILDKENNYIIYSENVKYFKNEEKIVTKGNSKALTNNTIIYADEFDYYKKLNIFKAKKNVRLEDSKEDIVLLTEEMSYEKEKQNIFTYGFTEALIQKKYNFYSKNILFNRESLELSSKFETTILDDKFNIYETDEFTYFRNINLFKGKNIKITTNRNLPNEFSDKLFFKDGFFNIKNGNFSASNTDIYMKKNIFENKENDPRLKGISSFKENEMTQINKGIFTSCKKNDSCPPWHIQAKKIKHDKSKNQLIYDDALLKIYDIPVVYFPKFFHPDPSVERQSGFLKPVLNESQILGSSFKIPYFHIISKDKDVTITPNFFNSDMFMIENEYRQKTDQSTLLADFGFTKNYKSKNVSKKKNISHLFAKYKLDLNLDDYISSKLNLGFEKVTKDTYLKIFDGNLSETKIKPVNKDQLKSFLDLSLDHSDFNFSTGLTSYENLSGKNSDRYQFILPYYNFSKNLFTEQNLFKINLNSSGSNNLKNTNNLRSRVINNLTFESFDYISELGFKNNLKIYTKNLNTVAKHDALYKSSPQVELMSIFELSSALPLIKIGDKFDKYVEPKFSFRFNPSDMKDYSNSGRRVDVSNIFSIDRLGLSDTFEEGKSLTVGIDYKKESIKDINRYFEIKIASVFRDKVSKKIPSSSSINDSGNLIGSVENSINENVNLTYDFSIDNNLTTIEYNALSAELKYNKFTTGLKFVEENGDIGDSNSLENTLTYEFDENNFLSFKTRRNRKINLTEFYDLIYEYKNDCLTAGIKYKKTYYQDRDLLPTEDLLFSITIFPLTTYEQNIDREFITRELNR